MDIKLIMLIEYIKLHIISLEQEAEKLELIKQEFLGDYDSEEYEGIVLDDYYNTGELTASHHLLKIAQQILEKGEEWIY